MNEHVEMVRIASTIPTFDKIEISALELLNNHEIEVMAKEAADRNIPCKARTIDIVRYLVGLSLKDVILLRHQELFDEENNHADL